MKNCKFVYFIVNEKNHKGMTNIFMDNLYIRLTVSLLNVKQNFICISRDE